jgi:hypothetical protein
LSQQYDETMLRDLYNPSTYYSRKRLTEELKIIENKTLPSLRVLHDQQVEREAGMKQGKVKDEDLTVTA